MIVYWWTNDFFTFILLQYVNEAWHKVNEFLLKNNCWVCWQCIYAWFSSPTVYRYKFCYFLANILWLVWILPKIIRLHLKQRWIIYFSDLWTFPKFTWNFTLSLNFVSGKNKDIFGSLILWTSSMTTLERALLVVFLKMKFRISNQFADNVSFSRVFQ